MNFSDGEEYIRWVSFMQIIHNSQVVLFMNGTPKSPSDIFSQYAVEVLKHYQIKPYAFVDLTREDDMIGDLRIVVASNAIPQLFVGSKYVGGCELLVDMHHRQVLGDLFKAYIQDFEIRKSEIMQDI